MFLLAVPFLLLSTVHADYRPAQYRIQLDSPPSSRWDQVVDDHMHYMQPYRQAFASIPIPRPLRSLLWMVAENIRHFFPSDYAMELEGVANRSGLSLVEVVGWNILYDITTFDTEHTRYQGCTSIVACDDNGRILHGRNMDYEMGMLLKQTTINVDFYQGDELLYSGTTFVLYIGLLTGQRPGGFSVSLNQRYFGPSIMNVAMGILTKFRNPVSFLIRQTLEEESSFDRAVEIFSTAPLVAPAYSIVGGMKKWEGVVITRDRLGTVALQILNEQRWFIVATNFDHYRGEDGDDRRFAATRLLSEMVRSELDSDTFSFILSTSPLRNKLTIHSGVMTAADPSIFPNTTVVIDD